MKYVIETTGDGFCVEVERYKHPELESSLLVETTWASATYTVEANEAIKSSNDTHGSIAIHDYDTWTLVDSKDPTDVSIQFIKDEYVSYTEDKFIDQLEATITAEEDYYQAISDSGFSIVQIEITLYSGHKVHEYQ